MNILESEISGSNTLIEIFLIVKILFFTKLN